MSKDTSKDSAQTPLMKQYRDIKKKYPHAVVFFRLGDFYEMFGEDARRSSSVLGLTLTKRNGVPMCGVPYHASSRYVAKLLKEGKNVAICEQMEVPARSNSKLVERKVTRVITPGTIMEDELLDRQNSNYLLCISANNLSWAAACLEVSTGDFWATQQISGDDFRRLSGLITRVNPSEIITNRKTFEELRQKSILNNTGVTIVPDNEDHTLPENWADTRLVIEEKQLALRCALDAYKYVEKNEPQLKGLLIPDYREDDKYLYLDENAIKTLELVESAYETKNQTLLGVLNYCFTAMGMRLLRQWILHPLMDISEIKKRQNSIEILLDEDKRSELCEILKKISDIERIVTRITAKSASPRDVAGLRDSLAILENYHKWLENSGLSDIYEKINPIYDKLLETYNFLSRSIVCEDIPNKIGEGKDLIKAGYDKELDELRSVKKDSGFKLSEIQKTERGQTGIPSLKVGYNSVFGYYLEVTKTHMAKVPYRYVRKQTLVNCERFITQELKELESKILGAEDRIFRLENHLFEDIKTRLSRSAKELKIFAKSIAELDVYLSLASVAVKRRYTKPAIDTTRKILIEKGRHPIVEHNIDAGEFVRNDLSMGDDLQIMIITGPNMSGKSVYLRQNALIVIMAQMGSFVPAEKADISITDRIMTRIGARDILSKGDSTFMVEMKETANILNFATSKSLVLLDEVGRGTSTFDGVSIAWAVAEFLYDIKKGPKVLFATHYFELTELEHKYPGIKNFNVKVEEVITPEGESELVFLHRVESGPSDKSYGIHVAELAGINPSCILRARRMLKELENKLSENKKLPLIERHQILEEIADCKPEKLTPLEALKIISEWKKRL